MSDPVAVVVPSLLSVDLDANGKVCGWRVVEGVTGEKVQRSVDTARIWREDDVDIDRAWDRYMERLESVCDTGPECPEVEE